MRRDWRLWLWLIGATWALPAAVASAGACPGQPVEVRGGAEALADVCLAAGRALEFLERIELRPKRAILIEMVEHPLDGRGHPVYGTYDGREDLVRVMTLGAVQATLSAPTMYEEAFDREHFLGVVAHEVAHAVVQHNGLVERLSSTAQEYLAHATQLAVMPEERRAALVRAAGVGPWEPDDVITDVYMALAPHRFAVKSYLHLTGQDDPLPFVRILLSARSRYVAVR